MSSLAFCCFKNIVGGGCGDNGGDALTNFLPR